MLRLASPSAAALAAALVVTPVGEDAPVLRGSRMAIKKAAPCATRARASQAPLVRLVRAVSARR